MYAETFDHNIEDKVVEIYPDGIESSSSDSERQIDVITRDESGENNSLDTPIKETKSLSSSASGGKSSSFSLSELSSEDLFGIDSLKFSTSDASEPAPKSEKNYVSSSDESSAKSEKSLSSNDFFGIDNLKFTTSNASEPAPKSEKNYISSSGESSAKSETNYSRPPLPTSTYQVYNVAYSPKCMSPTLSPPIQVMDPSGGYDPSRIPSSTFEINSNINPLEWSIASNESLFSIHIDQNSFSKDTFKFRESQRSEKLTKPVEQNTFNQIPSVPIEKIDIANKSDDIENLEPLEESFRFKPHLNEVQHEIKSLHEIVNMSTKSSATSSFENETTRHSFVPLKKRSRRFFNYCNCSWGFCYHKLPTCWPSCNCSCGWLFCRCCNSTPCTPILAETDGNSFGKGNGTPGQESYKEGSETTSIYSKYACNSCNWFHCFTCPNFICNLCCARCKCCC